jgi:hypothetical protein
MAMNGGNGSLVEGLRGLEGSAVEDLCREWQMMEQSQQLQQRAWEASAAMPADVKMPYALGAPGPVSQPDIDTLSSNIQSLLQLHATVSDKARYANVEMQSRVVGA